MNWKICCELPPPKGRGLLAKYVKKNINKKIIKNYGEKNKN